MWQTQTPLPAASPSAFTTHGGRATASERAVGTPAASITSFENAFEPSIRAAAGAGAEHGDADVAKLVCEPRDERRLRADDDEIDSELACERHERCLVVGVHRMALRERRDARVAGRSVQLAQARAARERPRERVLAAPGSDDEHLHAVAVTRAAQGAGAFGFHDGRIVMLS